MVDYSRFAHIADSSDEEEEQSHARAERADAFEHAKNASSKPAVSTPPPAPSTSATALPLPVESPVTARPPSAVRAKERKPGSSQMSLSGQRQILEEQRDAAATSLLSKTMERNHITEEARASAKALLENPHFTTNLATRRSGRDLVKVLKNIEDYDIDFHCFACRAVVPSHRNRCGKCKAIMYCSKACQQRDWTHGPGGGQKPHKAWCPLLVKHMERLPETQSLVNYFPWLRLTESGTFPRDTVLSALGLLGQDVGYWSKPSSRSSHAAQHQSPKRYGVMLYQPIMCMCTCMCSPRLKASPQVRRDALSTRLSK